MWITGATTLCGIVGDPIEHSLSPMMHNVAFETSGLNFVYVPFRLPRGAAEIGARAMRSLGIRGLNVTVPHKVDIMRFLDQVEPSAMRIGAVNTIVSKDGYLCGHNTDAPGFLRGLELHGIEVKDKEVVVLGAGGAARAVAFSLLDRGARLTVLNRNVVKAASLAEDVAVATGARIMHDVLADTALETRLASASLLVNATTGGMHPHWNETPCPRRYLRRDLAVCDIVYNPPQTRLLKDAAASGAVVVNGVEMLVQQGALAFQLWTGTAAPVDVMRSIVCRELGHGSH